MAEEEEKRHRMREEAKEVDEEGEEENGGPAQHPSPPPDELFDISTTVDPSYVISLIRKLLPNDSGYDICKRSTQEQHHQTISADQGDKAVFLDSENECVDTLDGCPESMDIGGKNDESTADGNGENSSQRREKLNVSSMEEAWEEHGCVLWDLAASRTHAELMVDNLILEVLHASLMVSKSLRVTEICLGIIGNLACHEVPLERIESTAGLANAIVGQLFLDDAQCLSEVCRILTSGLYGVGCTSWAESLQSDEILRRLLWITENTLNPQLIEKSVGLLLSIVEGQPRVQQLLIPPLMNLALASLLIGLLSFEMNKLMTERSPERYSVLDMILRAIEALSVLDTHSHEICSSKELFRLVCDLVKFQDKSEVSTCCVTAGVLVANMLSETADLTSEISHDFAFLEGVFNTLPFASDDREARRALWNVIAKLLFRVNESDINLNYLLQYIRILVSNSDIIEDDLLDLQVDESKSSSRTIAIQKMVCILNKWNVRKETTDDENLKADVERLLNFCHRYISNG